MIDKVLEIIDNRINDVQTHEWMIDAKTAGCALAQLRIARQEILALIKGEAE